VPFLFSTNGRNYLGSAEKPVLVCFSNRYSYI
jgi:hypothetical protein